MNLRLLQYNNKVAKAKRRLKKQQRKQRRMYSELLNNQSHYRPIRKLTEPSKLFNEKKGHKAIKPKGRYKI